MLWRAGPLWAGRCRRENGLAVLPPGKSGGLFLYGRPSSPRRRFAVSSSRARSDGVRLSSPSSEILSSTRSSSATRSSRGGTGATRITAGGGRDYGAEWTPDGKELIYIKENPYFDLYRRAADASRPADASCS